MSVTNHKTWRLTLALCGWLTSAVLSAAEPAAPAPAKPPPFTVTADVAAEYPRVPVQLTGVEVNPKTHEFWRVERKYGAPVLPPCGNPLRFVLSVTANAADTTVHFDGAVTDYRGTVLAKVACDVAAAQGQTASQTVEVKPGPETSGPFYLRAAWRAGAGGEAGTVTAAAGQANWHAVLDDYEEVLYPEPGGVLESSAAARHRGERGLLLRLLPGKEPKAQRGERADANADAGIRQAVPLNLELAGRPVKLGVWMKAAADVTVSLQLHDPGIEVRQSTQLDAWVVGPVPVAAGDWRYVELPMPGYGRPLAERQAYGEPNGVADYPLTAESLVVEGPSGTEVWLDDVDLWTEGEAADALAAHAGFEKPARLLYRDDRFSLVVANRWLWPPAADLSVSLGLRDIRGQTRALYAGKVTVAPGAELVVPIEFHDVPLGGYLLAPEIRRGEQRARWNGDARVMVYEPGNARPSPRELSRLLADRNRLLRELGFTSDILMVPWHSVDNTPSVEPRMGQWNFDWIAPEIEARTGAGLQVMGRLGFTPLWADPTATWNKRMRSWYGSTTGMPSRDVFWEEYVLRTVERFSGSIHTWIVWERPDSGALGATAEEFAERLVGVAAKAARQADPTAKLVSGGIAREHIEEYLVALAETGMAGALDGIGVLPTTAPLSPEDGYLDVLLSRAQRIREQEQLRPELWVLGLGWVTGDEQNSVSEFDQALYVPRAFALCRAQGIRQVHLQADEENQPLRRDAAAFVYPAGPLLGLKPAALAAKTVRAQLDGAEFVQEIALNDRQDGVARAYLFRRPDQRLVLAAWRREGESRLPLATAPAAAWDIFGNRVTLAAGVAGAPSQVVLRPDLLYLEYSGVTAETLSRQLTRTPLGYEDAPESAWKAALTFHLDVGDAADEQAAGYSATQSRVVGPVDSRYFTDYGRRVVDSGRHFTGEERFTVPVAAFGTADLILRRRINYSVPDQRCKVYCNGALVGQWFSWKRDPRYRWRDLEFVIPNRFFGGKPAAEIRVVAAGGEATSYYYWAGPLRSKTLYVSDLSLLVGSSGYGPGVLRDKNILGGALKFFRKDGDRQAPASFAKGIGTNGAAALSDSLVVIGLNQQYKRFRATVGIDAAADGRGSVRFRVHDGLKTLWDSKDMTFYSEPKEIDLDVSDTVLLMLWTGDAGDGNRDDLADWVNARLELK